MRPIVAERAEEFRSLCFEREAIRLKREAGEPEPWTADPILRAYHFCNVFREDDRTSRAILGSMRNCASVAGAVLTSLAGRLTNNASAARDVIEDDLLHASEDELAASFSVHKVNVGAYKIHTPLGLWNRRGMAQMIVREREIIFHTISYLRGARTFHEAFKTIAEKPCGGRPCLVGFQAYQIALDLLTWGMWKGTAFDGEDWTYIGPGAVRGSRYLCGDVIEYHHASRDFNAFSPALRVESLEACQALSTWINSGGGINGRAMSIHDVEFMLCEFDKYRRRVAGGKGGRKRRKPQ